MFFKHTSATFLDMSTSLIYHGELEDRWNEFTTVDKTSKWDKLDYEYFIRQFSICEGNNSFMRAQLWKNNINLVRGV